MEDYGNDWQLDSKTIQARAETDRLTALAAVLGPLQQARIPVAPMRKTKAKVGLTAPAEAIATPSVQAHDEEPSAAKALSAVYAEITRIAEHRDHYCA